MAFGNVANYEDKVFVLQRPAHGKFDPYVYEHDFLSNPASFSPSFRTRWFMPRRNFFSNEIWPVGVDSLAEPIETEYTQLLPPLTSYPAFNDLFYVGLPVFDPTQISGKFYNGEKARVDSRSFIVIQTREKIRTVLGIPSDASKETVARKVLEQIKLKPIYSSSEPEVMTHIRPVTLVENYSNNDEHINEYNRLYRAWKPASSHWHVEITINSPYDAKAREIYSKQWLEQNILSDYYLEFVDICGSHQILLRLRCKNKYSYNYLDRHSGHPLLTYADQSGPQYPRFAFRMNQANWVPPTISPIALRGYDGVTVPLLSEYVNLFEDRRILDGMKDLFYDPNRPQLDPVLFTDIENEYVNTRLYSEGVGVVPVRWTVRGRYTDANDAPIAWVDDPTKIKNYRYSSWGLSRVELNWFFIGLALDLSWDDRKFFVADLPSLDSSSDRHIEVSFYGNAYFQRHEDPFWNSYDEATGYNLREKMVYDYLVTTDLLDDYKLVNYLTADFPSILAERNKLPPNKQFQYRIRDRRHFF